MADAPSKDPSVTWRELVSQWEKNVNSLANQTMASEEFSGASNQMMNVSLKVEDAPRRRRHPKAVRANRPPRTKRPPSLADES